MKGAVCLIKTRPRGMRMCCRCLPLSKHMLQCVWERLWLRARGGKRRQVQQGGRERERESTRPLASNSSRSVTCCGGCGGCCVCCKQSEEATQPLPRPATPPLRPPATPPLPSPTTPPMRPPATPPPPPPAATPASAPSPTTPSVSIDSHG